MFGDIITDLSMLSHNIQIKALKYISVKAKTPTNTVGAKIIPCSRGLSVMGLYVDIVKFNLHGVEGYCAVII
jgi:hypothetical protein